MSLLRWLVCVALALSVPLACGDEGESDGSSDGSDGTGDSGMTTMSTGSSAGTSTSSGIDSSSEASSASSTSGVSSSSEGSTGSSASGTTGLGDCHPLLVEALYDADDGDDFLQWVKLYNPCSEAIDLSTWSIGYGGTDYGPPSVKGLSDSIDAGGCYVVGGPTADATNGGPIYHYADDFAPNLDLAQEAGGGVALFDVPVAEVDATTIPLDAVVYGPDNANGLIDETGRPVAAPHVGSTGPGASMQRTSEDATWVVAATPTPNDCPPF